MRSRSLLASSRCPPRALSEKAEVKPSVDESKRRLREDQALAGDWSGPGGEGAEMATVNVRYRVTAAGSVVEETIMPGTPTR
jgi:hypothetical protein